MGYLTSLDRKRDYNNIIAYAKKEGAQEECARAEAERTAERLDSARKFKEMGILLLI